MLSFFSFKGEKYNVKHEKNEGLSMKSPSEIMESLDVPDGENINACENLIHSDLRYYQKSYAEKFISNDLKVRFDLTKEEVQHLKQFYKQENKVSFAEIGDLILSKFSIFTMEDTKEIYIYKEGVYKNKGSLAKLGTIIREVSKNHGHLASTAFVNEVIAHIQAYTFVDREYVDKGQYINFSNGLFNLSTWELEEHRKNYYSIRQIPVDYDPEATCPNIEKFLSEVVDPENIPLIYEWIGLSLIPETKFQKALMLYGKGGNGKTVFLNLFVKFLGIENIARESLQKLETDKYSVANLYGKLMNICPDIPSNTLHTTDIFKQLAGDDHFIRGERKYQDAFSFKNTARLTFSANQLPKGNIDYAFSRRWILINFPNSFENNQDKELDEKLTPELSGLLNLALEGLKRLQKNREFSNSKSVDDTQKEYLINCDPVRMFLDECTELTDDTVSHDDMYEYYELWAEEKKIPLLKENPFCKQMKSNGVFSHRITGFDEKTQHFRKMSHFVGIALK